jgi:hypothetical protein
MIKNKKKVFIAAYAFPPQKCAQSIINGKLAINLDCSLIKYYIFTPIPFQSLDGIDKSLYHLIPKESNDLKIIEVPYFFGIKKKQILKILHKGIPKIPDNKIFWALNTGKKCLNMPKLKNQI